MSLTRNELMQVLRMIETADRLEMDLEFGDARVRIAKGIDQGLQPEQPYTDRGTHALEDESSRGTHDAVKFVQSPVPGEHAHDTSEQIGHVLRAPIAGTFYYAPSPSDAPFVEVGDSVRADDVVGILEVMKLFNSIPAGVDGIVSRFYVQNAESVSQGQPLLQIAPGTGVAK